MLPQPGVAWPETETLDVPTMNPDFRSLKSSKSLEGSKDSKNDENAQERNKQRVMISNGITRDVAEEEEYDKSKFKLHYKVNDVPPLPLLILFGFQQGMLVISGVLTIPYLVSQLVCPGSDLIELRVKLISSTFVTAGIATLIHSTWGLRLPLLNGPTIIFIAPIISYSNIAENKCNATIHTFVPREIYEEKLLTISGSLFLAILIMPLAGATGLIGLFSKFLGPITITPLVLLLVSETVPTIATKMGEHWVSIVVYALLMSFILPLKDLKIPLPYFSFKRRKCTFIRFRLLGLFPYVFGIGISWLLCAILTWTNAVDKTSAARTDKNVSELILKQSAWISVPYPGQFGFPKVEIGLFFGFLASSIACMVEAVGCYAMLATVTQQNRPPQHAINRTMICEGFSCALGALMGCGSGVNTFVNAISLIPVTKIACRSTMQVAGLLLIIAGLFTKISALLAAIPDPVIGGTLAAGMSMLCGVSLSNLMTVDLRKPRNLIIMGMAFVMGLTIPHHFMENPLSSGNRSVDSVFNMILVNEMLIGGFVAFVLDNVIPGATYAQRGLHKINAPTVRIFDVNNDGYAFPSFVNRFLLRFKFLCWMPFLPSAKEVSRVEELRRQQGDRNPSYFTIILSKFRWLYLKLRALTHRAHIDNSIVLT